MIIHATFYSHIIIVNTSTLLELPTMPTVLVWNELGSGIWLASSLGRICHMDLERWDNHGDLDILTRTGPRPSVPHFIAPGHSRGDISGVGGFSPPFILRAPEVLRGLRNCR